jgi:tetratricopeptide (TPR) repeat protein
MARFEKLEFQAKTEPTARTEHTARRDVDWLLQADEERRRGHYENALRLYSRALELDKSLVEGWLGQVQQLVLLDEVKEAELWSRKALELFPNNGDLMGGRAQALCRLGDLKQGHIVSDGAIKQPGQSAYRWIVRGELMLAARQDVEQHCFGKARQLSSDWLVALEIALVYLFYDRPSRALDQARQAVETGADSAYAWFVQGRCEAELGLVRPAQRSLARCRELCPDHAEAQRLATELGSGGVSFFRRLKQFFRR